MKVYRILCGLLFLSHTIIAHISPATYAGWVRGVDEASYTAERTDRADINLVAHYYVMALQSFITLEGAYQYSLAQPDNNLKEVTNYFIKPWPRLKRGQEMPVLIQDLKKRLDTIYAEKFAIRPTAGVRPSASTPKKGPEPAKKGPAALSIVEDVPGKMLYTMIGTTKIVILQGDITEQKVDAIVNAAKPSLEGGGGIDGAIHRAAGPQLLAACLKIPKDNNGVRCPTGQARLTPGFKLPAKYVIHTVGPEWSDGNHDEDALLTSCYTSCLKEAEKAQPPIKSIAFCAISTGIYGFPLVRATNIALTTVINFIKQHPKVFNEIIFVCWQDSDYAAYAQVVRGIKI